MWMVEGGGSPVVTKQKMVAMVVIAAMVTMHLACGVHSPR